MKLRRLLLHEAGAESHKIQPCWDTQRPAVIIRHMAVEKKDAKDRVGKDKTAGSKGKEEPRSVADDSAGEEGELTEVKPKTGEPSDNLHRRAEWFQKRH